MPDHSLILKSLAACVFYKQFYTAPTEFRSYLNIVFFKHQFRIKRLEDALRNCQVEHGRRDISKQFAKQLEIEKARKNATGFKTWKDFIKEVEAKKAWLNRLKPPFLMETLVQ